MNHIDRFDELMRMWNQLGGHERIRKSVQNPGDDPYLEMKKMVDELISRQGTHFCICGIIGSAMGIHGMECPVHKA